MLTPDCRPEQICLEENRAVWKAENEKTGEYYIALFNLAEEEAEVGFHRGSRNAGGNFRENLQSAGAERRRNFRGL